MLTSTTGYSGRVFRFAIISSFLLTTTLFLAACGGGGGGGGGNGESSSSPTITSVTVSCNPTSVHTGQTSQCTAAVTGTGTYSSAVTWSASAGTIDANGKFTAPATPGSVTVTAQSTEATTKSGTAIVTVTVPGTITSISVVCSPSAILMSQTSTCAATVQGTGAYDSTVTWTATDGTITSSGAFTPTSSGTATITATSAQDTTKSGTASIAVATPTALVITITDLPTGALANVTATDPDGQQTKLTSSQIINAIPGTYTLTAGPVVVGTSTYSATAITQTATVTSGNATTATVDYKNAVPATTKVLDSAAETSLAISSDGLTLTMSASSPVAQSLSPGDVIVVSPTSADGVAPKGMLRKVVSVSSNDSQIVATTEMGTLAEAFERVSFQIQTELASNTIKAVHLAPGVTFHPGASLRRAVNGRKLQAASASLPDPCEGYSLGIFDVPESIQIDAVPGLTLSGSVEVCSGLNFSVDIGFTGLNSLTATAAMAEYSDLTLQGDFLSGSFDLQPVTLATLEFGAIPIGGLPVWVTPEVSVFVGANGNLTSGFYTEVSESGTFTGGVSYASGTWSPVLTPSLQFAYQPPTLDASMSAKAYAGVEFDLYIYSVVGPSFKPDGYLDFEANITQTPWWTLTGGLEGPMSLDVTILGENLASYNLGTLFDYSRQIASATTPFLPAAPAIQSLTPQLVAAGASSFSLSVVGSNFIPGAVVNFGSTSLAATWQSSSQLTASVPSSRVSAAGTFQVSVTNPGAPGATSNSLPFTVTGSSENPVPAITQLSPASLPIGSAPQMLTISGAGFLASSTVTFNGIAHAAVFVSASQLTISLTSADLATAGNFPVVVTNPAPGGGASAPVDFTISSENPVPVITALSPASLPVDSAPQTLTINGTGFLASSTVTFNGIAHAAVFVSASQLTIALTSADLATAGTFPVVVTNPVPGGGASTAASFSVTNGQTSNQWTWMSGADTSNQSGVYGTEGIAAAANVPGARTGAVSWIDSNGNLWLFGGDGYDSAVNEGILLNDLWEFNPTSKTWTWMSGSSTGSGTGVYGTQGVPAAANVPGDRMWAVSWIDASGNLWLFGGLGLGSGGEYPYLNDLWEFSPTSKTWTWMSGSSTGGATGVYGTQGAPAAANVPGGRVGAVSWTDASGNLWLFGGQGYDSAGSEAYLDDLWEFNPTSNTWTWISGADTGGQPGIYGTLGVPAAANVPGGREFAVSWIDGSGNLWLFGGYGFDSIGNGPVLNDLWEFNPTAYTWTWMSGSSTAGATGVYGRQGVPAAPNIPGAREGTVNWIDGSRNLWLFGGWGEDSTGTFGYLNDLWEFNSTSNTWTWMSGADTGSQPGIYGTLGVPAANVPGSRASAVSWIDASGNFWLFGGYGYDSVGNEGYLNDLWRYQPETRFVTSVRRRK